MIWLEVTCLICSLKCHTWLLSSGLGSHTVPQIYHRFINQSLCLKQKKDQSLYLIQVYTSRLAATQKCPIEFQCCQPFLMSKKAHTSVTGVVFHNARISSTVICSRIKIQPFQNQATAYHGTYKNNLSDFKHVPLSCTDPVNLCYRPRGYQWLITIDHKVFNLYCFISFTMT